MKEIINERNNQRKKSKKKSKKELRERNDEKEMKRMQSVIRFMFYVLSFKFYGLLIYISFFVFYIRDTLC